MKTLFNKPAQWVIRWVYRPFISPLFSSFGGRCRFYPSCSCYAEQAFGRFGFFKALGLSLYRVLRCQPYGLGGYDPISTDNH